jgi:hypothetical protein
MRKLLVLAGAALLCCTAVYGQTPDGETPANEGLCDFLWGGTPGLYGLCVAFCEAQDCDPDFSLEDPYENCLPSSPKLLEIYNQKKQDGDPDMPCVKPECPCWTAEELAGLRYPSPGDEEVLCEKDQDFWNLVNRDLWRIVTVWPTRASVRTVEHQGRLRRPTCMFMDRCYDGSTCTNEYRNMYITPAEFATCEQQLNQAGADRGISCFVD